MVQESPFVGIQEVRSVDGKRQKRDAAAGSPALMFVWVLSLITDIPVDLNDRPQDSVVGGTGDFILRNSL
jgi:hypothetical protein